MEECQPLPMTPSALLAVPGGLAPGAPTTPPPRDRARTVGVISAAGVKRTGATLALRRSPLGPPPPSKAVSEDVTPEVIRIESGAIPPENHSLRDSPPPAPPPAPPPPLVTPCLYMPSSSSLKRRK